MKKTLNIILLVLIFALLFSMCGYFMYKHFHNNLEDVELTVIRNDEDGFIDYDDTYKTIINICDTANNTQINMIDVDSIVNALKTNKWTMSVDANINLKSVMEIEIEECNPIMRVYNSRNKSVYIDNQGNVFPDNDNYTPHLLICSGNINFPTTEQGNVNDTIYDRTGLPEAFMLMKEILNDDYSRNCVRHVFKDKDKNYIFSLNNTNIIVIFGDVNNIKEKLFKMKHFFMRMQGNPELDSYKTINLNFNNQVVCTKK